MTRVFDFKRIEQNSGQRSLFFTNVLNYLLHPWPFLVIGPQVIPKRELETLVL